MKRIRVLAVDATTEGQLLLQMAFRNCSDIKLVGVAGSGREAVKLGRGLEADILALSVGLPDMTAADVLRAFQDNPIPVILLSSPALREAAIAKEGMEHGALDCIWKPTGHDGISEFGERLLAKIRSVMHRGGAPKAVSGAAVAKNVVVVGASTGGPKIVKAIISQLPADLNAAVLVVQHLSDRFTGLIVAGLTSSCTMRVQQARDGDVLAPGSVFVTPGDNSLKVVGDPSGARLRLVDTESPHHIQPWIDLTMETAAKVFGKRCVGVLLTGMGADGVAGMRQIKASGGTTFAQDEASSMIFGMAKEAIGAGVVDYVLSPEHIAEAVLEKINSLG